MVKAPAKEYEIMWMREDQSTKAPAPLILVKLKKDSVNKCFQIEIGMCSDQPHQFLKLADQSLSSPIAEDGAEVQHRISKKDGWFPQEKSLISELFKEIETVISILFSAKWVDTLFLNTTITLERKEQFMKRNWETFQKYHAEHLFQNEGSIEWETLQSFFRGFLKNSYGNFSNDPHEKKHFSPTLLTKFSYPISHYQLNTLHAHDLIDAPPDAIVTLFSIPCADQVPFFP